MPWSHKLPAPTNRSRFRKGWLWCSALLAVTTPHQSPGQESLYTPEPAASRAEAAITPQPMWRARDRARQVGGPGRMVGARYDYEYVEAGSTGYAEFSGEGDRSATEGGYFPTKLETQYLPPNNPDYSRAKGDGAYWGYSGLWPVRPASDNYYQRNGAFYDRVDRGLGIFIPDENLLAHSDQPDAWSIDLNYGLPFLTRDVAPDRAMVKLGPLYIDVLGLSFSTLYTSYSGDAPLGEDIPEEGWIAIVGLPMRASLRITDTIYLQASGFFYYLPSDGEVGVSSGIGSGWNLATNARLNFEWEYGAWSFRLFDYFGFVSDVAQLQETWQVNEIDAVGRYRYGALGAAGESEMFWDPRFGGYRNDVGFEGQRPMPNDWWFIAAATHSDYWPQEDFDDHVYYDQISLLYRYVGDDLMFAPSFMYAAGSDDRFDTITHRFTANVTGRVTEYLSAYGTAGYLWQTGDNDGEHDSVLWELGVIHDLTPYTQHSLSGGQTYELTETLDEYVGEYARYTISHQVGSRLSASAYAQWQDARNLDTDERSRGWVLGTRARYMLGQETGLTAGVTYALEEPNSAFEGVPDTETWIYYAMLERPLLSRLHGTATYQYIDSSGPIGSNFNEHLLILSLNLSF